MKKNFAYKYTIRFPEDYDSDSFIQKIKDNIGIAHKINSSTLYLKNIENKYNSIILLIGKDNESASNFKRDTSKNQIKTVSADISENECLTDLTHLAIKKEYLKCAKTDDILITIWMEYNSLFRIESIHNLILKIYGEFPTGFNPSLSQDYQNLDSLFENKSNRILSIISTDRIEQTSCNAGENTIEITSKNHIIKASRGKGLSKNIILNFFKKDKENKEYKLNISNNGKSNVLHLNPLTQEVMRYIVKKEISQNNKNDEICNEISNNLDNICSLKENSNYEKNSKNGYML